MPARKREARPYSVFRPESWEAFLKIITSSPYSNWAFRGERDERFPLYSSLSRYLQSFNVSPKAWAEQEARILRVFKRKAHQFLSQPPAPEDDFQWLALMQHHGAPTRLIDFTWSPYVAAFFALERTVEDGVVWAMNPARVESSRHTQPARMDPRAVGNFDRYFLKGNRRFIWMGEPHTMNRRLIAQSGTFAVPGVLNLPIERILGDAHQNNTLAKIILRNEVREHGMRELYRMNITYATLFPDLDGLAKSMGYELEFHWRSTPPHTHTQLSISLYILASLDPAFLRKNKHTHTKATALATHTHYKKGLYPLVKGNFSRRAEPIPQHNIKLIVISCYSQHILRLYVIICNRVGFSRFECTSAEHQHNSVRTNTDGMGHN
jgi:hypothetical protein